MAAKRSKKRQTTRRVRKRQSAKRRKKSQSVKRRKKTQSATKFAKTIQQLKKLPQRNRLQAIQLANDSFIREFCNHVKRLKHSSLTPKQHRFIRAHKAKLRKLVNTRTSVQAKRRLLSQKGGFLGLLPLVASVAAPLIGKLFSG